MTLDTTREGTHYAEGKAWRQVSDIHDTEGSSISLTILCVQAAQEGSICCTLKNFSRAECEECTSINRYK